MAGSRALKYAEDTLGVHVVHDSAVAARDALDKVLTELGQARDARRSLSEQVADREIELLMSERGKHPEMSAAAMDKHLKVAYHVDEQLRHVRGLLRAKTEEIEGLEYDVQMYEHDIKIAVARMHELGGYMVYLAAVKTTTPAQPQPTGEQK
jgi:hypothetical protein